MADARKSWLTRRGVIGAGAAMAAAAAAYAFHAAPRLGIRHSSANARTFNRGNAAEPDTIDPPLVSTTYESNIVGEMFMGLMTEDAAGNPVLGAAEKVTASADGLTYTFHLRDHKWSDGVPVSADDFAFALRRTLDPKTASQCASLIYPILNAKAINAGKLPVETLGVAAPDPRTLVLRFANEVSYLTQLLTHYSMYPVPKHVVEKYGAQWTKPQNIAANGPYVLREWVSNDHILLTKNPHFYDLASLEIDNVYFYPTSDFTAALKRFRAGELDANNGVPAAAIPWLRRNMPHVLRLSPFALIRDVTFNVTQKPFDDIRVREAVSLAINREIIATKVMKGGEQPAYSYVPPGMPHYPGQAKLRFHAMPMAARLSRARNLLQQAGYSAQNPLVFAFNFPSQTDARLVAIALQQMWKSIGAQVSLVPNEDRVHYNLMRKQDFSAAWDGYAADYRDAKDFLSVCSAASRDNNFGRYSNPKYDALLDQSDRTEDATARGLLLQAAEQIMLDDMAMAPVCFGVTRDIVSTQVKGWISNNMDLNRSRYLRLDRTITSV